MEKIPLSAEIANAASFVDGDGDRWTGASQISAATLYRWASKVAMLELLAFGKDVRKSGEL